jgi:glycerol-3-phosphate O-acyltransferase
MVPDASALRVLPDEPGWPDGADTRIVFLLDASSGLERRLLESWIERNRPEHSRGDHASFPIPPSRRGRGRALDPRLEATLASPGDPLFAPLRIAWLPPLRDGERTARFSDLVTMGDPRDPNRLRQAWVVRRSPDCCRIVAGEPAHASQLRERWRESGSADAALTTGLAEFVARQAQLALERAERQLRGARYKVPRFVNEEILGKPSFRGRSATLASENGESDAAVSKRAARYLKEIAAQHSPLVIDLVARLIRRIYTQGYDETLLYDQEQLRGIARIAQHHPVVFLPTHKSNLDHLVLQYALHENGLPPNHTAGGINMNFFPMGMFFQRSGIFFIRRSFKNNELYKHVLRSYIDYLIEKRFSLEWYIEGGRSRSGKLLPPRFGLLAYVVDAFKRAKSEDVFLIPVSIAYDQIQEAGTYAAEQQGAAKRKEDFGWFLSFVRAMRRDYGHISIRFGEPLSLRAALGPPDPSAAPNSDEIGLELQKIAFEVSVRINRVTPITPTSLVTLSLLGAGDQALTVEQILAGIERVVGYVEERKLPTTADFDQLATAEGVVGILAALASNGVVSCYDQGPEAVYRIGPEQQLTAAYYRNTIVHFFITSAICELSLLAVAEGDAPDPVQHFFDAALELRDLLKFEFFFAESDFFLAELRRELARYEPEWEERICEGADAIQSLVQQFRPFSSHRVMRPFLEAYRVVSDSLASREPSDAIDRKAFLADCLSLGHQYLLQRRIYSGASVSQVLFETAFQIAQNRDLIESRSATEGDFSLGKRRGEFQAEIETTLRRVYAIEALAASRRAGLIA